MVAKPVEMSNVDGIPHHIHGQFNRQIGNINFGGTPCTQLIRLMTKKREKTIKLLKHKW